MSQYKNRMHNFKRRKKIGSEWMHAATFTSIEEFHVINEEYARTLCGKESRRNNRTSDMSKVTCPRCLESREAR